MRKIITLFTVITVFTVLFSSCEKKGNPPVLPPIETMQIDFSDFAITAKSGQISATDNTAKGVGNGNYQFASSVAGFWSTILTLNLVVPVAAFAESFDHSPVYLDNKKWQWSYNVTVVGAIYKARLTGQKRSSDVKWEMYISREGIGAFAEVLWFEGTSALDGNSGQWILNAKNEGTSTEQLLQIDWAMDGDNIGSVKYTYIKNDEAKNSYIEYGLTDAALNAYYTVHFYETVFLNSFVDVFIEWNTTAHNGRVKAFYEYTDNNWHCWDSNGNDVLCN